MAIKTALSADKSAGRKDRTKPTMRENVHYNVVPAHGVESLDYTKNQTIRSHEEANDPKAKSQGAIACGEDGFANAKRREAHVLAERKKTEAIFDSHRKFAAKYPLMAGWEAHARPLDGTVVPARPPNPPHLS